MIEFEKLINKANPLPNDYEPEHLYVTDNNENNFHGYLFDNLKPTIDERIVPYFTALHEAAKRDGHYFVVESGFRSYQYQVDLIEYFNEKYGKEYTDSHCAPAGTSEHQSGLAIDFGHFKDNKFFDSIIDNSEESKWLIENAHKFGFILRYPKGKEDETGYSYEPWHYRFVGVELATYLHNNDLTLEAYYEKKLTLKQKNDF